MTEDTALPRREILSGLATIGTVGAFSGGTAALLTSDELFVGNLLVSGKLDLGVCWEAPGEDCTPADGPASIDFGAVGEGDAGSASVRYTLSDNPGWVWLRTNCPDGPCGLERAVEVTLWHDEECDGAPDSARIIRQGRLCNVLSDLNGGILLDGDPPTDAAAPLEPGVTRCLGFSWEAVEPLCVEEDFELTFEFHTTQFRSNSAPENPFPPDRCDVDCADTADCPECAFQGISFVAFCVEDGDGIGVGDISFTPYFDAEGEPFKLDWAAAVPLEWVVLFYGSNDGTFFENFHVDGETSGTVQVNSPNADGFDSKLAWDGGDDVTEKGQCPRDPCPDFSGFEYGCGVKYNFDESTWDSVCGQTCPGEDGTEGS